MKAIKNNEALGAAPSRTPVIYSGNVMSINTQTASGSEYALIMVRSKADASGNAVDINETPVGIFVDPGSFENILDGNDNKVGLAIGDLISFVGTGLYEGKTSLGERVVHKVAGFEQESLTVVLKKRTYADETPVAKTTGGVAMALKDVASALADFLNR